MKLKVDTEADALYLHLNDVAIVESEEVYPGIILDFDADNQVVGIEIFGIKQRLNGDPLHSVTLEIK
jgi:uncharacterized protein YuzE